MNRTVLESQWAQIREILRDKFSNLTEDDIRQINGQYDQLVAKLQQKYGYSREEAEDRIRNWNFDRFASTKGQLARDERIEKRDREEYRREEGSTLLKWLLGLGIPLLLLGLYLLNADRTAETTRTTSQQYIVETPADRLLSTNLRNALLAEQTFAAEIPNIQIASHDGVVTLSGYVSNSAMRESIVKAAQNYAGVRQVVNNLQVR